MRFHIFEIQYDKLCSREHGNSIPVCNFLSLLNEDVLNWMLKKSVFPHFTYTSFFTNFVEAYVILKCDNKRETCNFRITTEDIWICLFIRLYLIHYEMFPVQENNVMCICFFLRDTSTYLHSKIYESINLINVIFFITKHLSTFIHFKMYWNWYFIASSNSNDPTLSSADTYR